MKDNRSFVRRGKRRNQYICLECGKSTRSIADNIHDFGENWRQYKGLRTGIHIDEDENTSQHEYLQYDTLNTIVRRLRNLRRKYEKEMDFYERVIKGYQENDI